MGEGLRQVRQVRLTFKQRMSLLLRGYCLLRWEKRPGWKAPLPIYLVKCPACRRLFEDYPHGCSGYFECPYCREEERSGK